MGFFGAYVYDGSRWLPANPARMPNLPEPWLMVDIYDSDFATVTYRPAGPGSGVAFLGDTPRSYFEDDGASVPTDVAREARALAWWWGRHRAGVDDADRAAKERLLATYLATDGAPVGSADPVEDANLFVEVKTAEFLAALDLPVPDELPG